MAYNIKDLNVSSLDFSDIVESLTSFLESQPTLANIDFRNTASAANMLINILATATAYNGVYSYFGFNESFKISAQNLESFSGLASNESILLPFTQSASTNLSLTAASTINSYTAFPAIGLDGSNLNFFNVEDISAGTSRTTLYCGNKIVVYTNYNYDGQYILLPLSVDPRTIKFVVTNITNTTTTTYTRVSRGEEATSSGNYFTVINGPNGYIVTNNFVNSSPITIDSKVEVYALSTNGAQGNGATISQPNGVTFVTSATPTGGYNTLSVEQARSLVLINGNGRKRWVTLNDLKYAIMSSGISGTDDESKITVANGSIPGQVKVYVDVSLSTANQTALLNYLTSIGPAGIGIVYSL
jgi:hypothetical protein